MRQTHYNMLLTAQKMRPYWGAAVLDGFEGMEGNGPASGTPVASRIAIASTDFIAADRVGVECMGIDPAWPGYLNYCGQLGLGNYDIAKIDVIGDQDRGRAEEVPDAQGYRARVGVDGRDEGPAAQAGLICVGTAGCSFTLAVRFSYRPGISGTAAGISSLEYCAGSALPLASFRADCLAGSTDR